MPYGGLEIHIEDNHTYTSTKINTGGWHGISVPIIFIYVISVGHADHKTCDDTGY